MKQIVYVILALLICTSGFNQQIKPENERYTKQYYLNKSKKLKTTGWIFLAGGTTMFVTGLVINNNTDYPYNTIVPESYLEREVVWLCLGGLSACLLSIPFFSLSRKKEKKANSMAIYLKFDNSTVLQQTRLAVINYPALSIRICLR